MVGEHALERRAAVVARGVPLATPLIVKSALGARLLGETGKSFIDLAAGIGVMTVGHCHPEVVAAVRKQAGELLHVCMHVATYEPYLQLCERLVELIPHGESTRVMLVNSGAEAVENAIKIARQATGRPGVLCYTGGFHGRTLLGMSLTSKVTYKTRCGPLAPEIYRIDYPNAYHAPEGMTEGAFVERELARLRRAFSDRVAPTNLAAILIEPVLGEGGFVPAPAGYLRGLRSLCDEHGIMLIADEVQSGLCRTGRWGAFEHSDITPDLSTWAKSLGGGLPLGAVIGKAHVMNEALPGTIGGTFGGNPVSCAAGLAVLDVMEREGLSARAEVIGTHVRERLSAMSERSPHVGDVRGLGAMVGMELSWRGDPTRPAGALGAAVVRKCLERGVLLLTAGVEGNVLRVLPPLVITDEDLDTALDAIAESLAEATATVPEPPPKGSR